MKAFRLCARRFAFRYIDGKKEVAGPAAEHGKFIHGEMEDWGLHGKRPMHPHAVAMIPHAPRPLSALAERKVTWRGRHSLFSPKVAPWTHLGILDFTAVLESLATMRTSPFLIPGAPILFGDYKTTSNLKYALEAYQGVLVDRETLEPDPQFLMYADYFLSNGWEDLTAKWIYSRTTGKTFVRPVVVRVDNNHVNDALCSVENDARAIHQLYLIRPKANDVPYSLKGCHAFGKPCDHLLYCNLPTRRASFDTLDLPDEDEGVLKMGAAEIIMSTFPGDATDLPPVEGEEMPPIPDEMPPILDEEEEETAGRGITETEQLRILAEELAKTERGFVNAPEAPERAAATPAENFAAHGEPVVEKRKFGKDDKPALLAFAIANGIVEKGSKLAAAGLAKAITAAGHDPAAVADTGATLASEVILTSAATPTPPDEMPDVEEVCGSQEQLDAIEEELESGYPTAEDVREANNVFVSEAAPTVPDGVLPAGTTYSAETAKALYVGGNLVACETRDHPLEASLSDALDVGLEDASNAVGDHLRALARALGATVTISFSPKD